MITHVFCFFVDQLNYTFCVWGWCIDIETICNVSDVSQSEQLVSWSLVELCYLNLAVLKLVGRGSKAFLCYIMSNHAVNVQFALKEIGFQEYVWRYEPQKHYRTIISHICCKSDATYMTLCHNVFFWFGWHDIIFSMIYLHSMRAASGLVSKTMTPLNSLKPCILSFMFEPTPKAS